ncbi:MAG TPA: outer membrane protein assembly factor BamE [Acidocella sp.]|nr:outer membrane protein assembly factor BamE [Acidocella sp.]
MRPAPLPNFNRLRQVLALGIALSLPGCGLFTDSPHYRGIAVSDHDLKELVVGTSLQADVQALLGPPTFHEEFNDNNWVYVSQITKMRIGQTEGVAQQQVVTLSFDNTGVLRKISKDGLKDRVDVAMDSATTPVPGGSASLVQQIIGGVGSYNPGLGGSGAGQGNAGAGALGGPGAGSSGNGF